MSDTILSARQEEVFGLLMEGYCTREIATELDVRISTVHTHIDRITEKRAKAERTLEMLDETKCEY